MYVCIYICIIAIFLANDRDTMPFINCFYVIATIILSHFMIYNNDANSSDLFIEQFIRSSLSSSSSLSSPSSFSPQTLAINLLKRLIVTLYLPFSRLPKLVALFNLFMFHHYLSLVFP